MCAYLTETFVPPGFEPSTYDLTRIRIMRLKTHFLNLLWNALKYICTYLDHLLRVGSKYKYLYQARSRFKELNRIN